MSEFIAEHHPPVYEYWDFPSGWFVIIIDRDEYATWIVGKKNVLVWNKNIHAS